MVQKLLTILAKHMMVKLLQFNSVSYINLLLILRSQSLNIFVKLTMLSQLGLGIYVIQCSSLCPAEDHLGKIWTSGLVAW